MYYCLSLACTTIFSVSRTSSTVKWHMYYCILFKSHLYYYLLLICSTFFLFCLSRYFFQIIFLMPYSIILIYVCQKKGGLEKHFYLKYALGRKLPESEVQIFQWYIYSFQYVTFYHNFISPMFFHFLILQIVLNNICMILELFLPIHFIMILSLNRSTGCGWVIFRFRHI